MIFKNIANFYIKYGRDHYKNINQDIKMAQIVVRVKENMSIFYNIIVVPLYLLIDIIVL